MAVNDEIFTGTPFQELLTNFPLGSTVVTGLSLNMELTSPGGGVEHEERALLDRIGYAARKHSTNASLAVDANGPPALTPLDITTVSVLPGRTEPHEPLALKSLMDSLSVRLADPNLAAAEKKRLAVALVTATTRALSVLNNQASDHMTEAIAKMARVRAYSDGPRLVLVSSRIVPGSTTTDPAKLDFIVDLRRDRVRSIVAPGQTKIASVSFQILHGIAATVIERETLASIVSEAEAATMIDAKNVFVAAAAQSIPTLLFLPSEAALIELRLGASPDALQRIREALEAGRVVQVPERPVTLGNRAVTVWYNSIPPLGKPVASARMATT